MYHAPSSQRPSHILLYLRLVPHLGRKETLGSCLCISKSPNLKRHVPKSVYSSRHFSTTVVHFQISYNKKLKYQILYPIIICWSRKFPFRYAEKHFYHAWVTVSPTWIQTMLCFMHTFPPATNKNSISQCKVFLYATFLPQIRPYPAPTKPVTSHLIVGPSLITPCSVIQRLNRNALN